MISICMSYYNRKAQLIDTLNSINKSIIDLDEGYEIIIVDDASSEEHRLEDVVTSMKVWMPITLVRTEPETKTWVNPCISYNKAISYAQGDKIIIQNPECMHVGNVLKYVENNLKKYQYMAFSCLSWEQTPFQLNEAKEITYPAPGQCRKGWYHHPIYNNRPYHFCCALHKENLDKLKGFDERFKDGPCYDDDDLVRRVKKLGLQIVSPTDPFVVHQWHESGHIYQEDSHQRFLNNQQIYNDIITGKLSSWS